MLERLLDTVDRPGGDARLLEDGEPTHGRFVLEHALDFGLEFRLVGEPLFVAGVIRVLSHRRLAERGGEATESDVVAGGDDDVAIGSGERLEGCDGRMARTERAGDLAADGVAHD